MLKADLHLHVQGDPRHHIKHTAQQLIDHAAKLNFKALSITNHDQLFYNQTLADYANSKGILLIPGIEKTIQGNEILIYNVTQEDVNKIKTLKDLEKIKFKKNIFTIAPHPFYLLPDCLGKNLQKYIHLFDAIEYCHFYHKLINRNKKAVKIAKKYNKPIVGTSDAHHLFQFNRTYTLINSKKDLSSVFNAIKNNQCQVVTQPLSLTKFIRVPLTTLILTNKRITFINKN